MHLDIFSVLVCSRFTGTDPGFWSGGPSGVLSPPSALNPKFAQNRVFSLKIDCKLHDFEKGGGQWGTSPPRAPWFRLWFRNVRSRACPWLSRNVSGTGTHSRKTLPAPCCTDLWQGYWSDTAPHWSYWCIYKSSHCWYCRRFLHSDTGCCCTHWFLDKTYASSH